jgi:methionyl-tRNA formyltransferase
VITTELRLGFAGTPALAAIILEHLLQDPGYKICKVFTQPDRPSGRGQKINSSPVKTIALKYGVTVLQPEKSADFDTENSLTQLDALIVVAYGRILPAEILQRPKFGCINIHTSLLPRWRGAAPIQRAIEAGDTETGITIMQMDEWLDTGPILHQTRCPISPSETSASLHNKLAELGSIALIDTLEKIRTGKIKPTEQKQQQATYAHKISKQEAIIDWSRPAGDLERKIRAFYPVPLVQADFNNVTFRIKEAKVLDQIVLNPPGTVISYNKDGIDVATGKGILRLLQIQPAGKKMMTVREFLNGQPDFFTGL